MTNYITEPVNLIGKKETINPDVVSPQKADKIKMVSLPSVDFHDQYEGREGARGDFDMLLKRAATPLNKYKADLKNQGVSDELTQDIIDGLADSPLHDDKTS